MATLTPRAQRKATRDEIDNLFKTADIASPLPIDLPFSISSLSDDDSAPLSHVSSPSLPPSSPEILPGGIFWDPDGLLLAGILKRRARKRGNVKKPVATAEKPVRKTDAPAQPRTRIRYTPAMTARIMTMFVDCKRDGMFSPTHKKIPAAVFERVAKEAGEVWPQFHWKPHLIKNKRSKECGRYHLWMIYKKEPGVTYNEKTGLLECSLEKTWAKFYRRFGHDNCNWLKTTSLGDESVYLEVFGEPPKLGENIRSCEEIIREMEAAAAAKKRPRQEPISQRPSKRPHIEL